MAASSFPHVSCREVLEEPGWAVPWPAWSLSQKAGLLMEGGCRERVVQVGLWGVKTPSMLLPLKVTEEQKVAHTA